MALVGGGESSQISFENMFNSVRCYSKAMVKNPLKFLVCLGEGTLHIAVKFGVICS